jgi:hypothetical protein
MHIGVVDDKCPTNPGLSLFPLHLEAMRVWWMRSEDKRNLASIWGPERYSALGYSSFDNYTERPAYHEHKIRVRGISDFSAEKMWGPKSLSCQHFSFLLTSIFIDHFVQQPRFYTLSRVSAAMHE